MVQADGFGLGLPLKYKPNVEFCFYADDASLGTDVGKGNLPLGRSTGDKSGDDHDVGLLVHALVRPHRTNACDGDKRDREYKGEYEE
jgi:hypothetical protein